MEPDSRGRATVALDDVIPHMLAPLSSDEIALLLLADGGDASAQCEIGQIFLLAGRSEAAVYWLQQAAAQMDGEAMHALAGCYLRGEGVEKDENLAIRWLADAAAHGHTIAAAQMQALRARILS